MTIPHRVRSGRALAVAVLAGAVLLAAAGCDVVFNTRTDGAVLDTTPTEVRIDGGSGDITLIVDPTVTGLDLRRTVRYRGAAPGKTYEVSGGVLTVRTDCGSPCTASYELRVPPRGSGTGVAVTGALGSGDMALTGPGRVDVRVGSGDLTVSDAGGDVTANISSGDVHLDGVAGAVTVDGSSGDVVARDLRGTVKIDISSGDITLAVDGAHNVAAHASSGDITATVPANRCQIRAETSSGDTKVAVTADPSSPVVVDLSTSSGDVTVS